MEKKESIFWRIFWKKNVKEFFQEVNMLYEIDIKRIVSVAYQLGLIMLADQIASVWSQIYNIYMEVNNGK